MLATAWLEYGYLEHVESRTGTSTSASFIYVRRECTRIDKPSFHV